jgi:hypothetical protein
MKITNPPTYFPIFTFAALMLIGLKLTGLINLSWWAVAIPLLVVPTLFILALALPAVVMCVIVIALFFYNLINPKAR